MLHRLTQNLLKRRQLATALQNVAALSNGTATQSSALAAASFKAYSMPQRSFASPASGEKQRRGKAPTYEEMAVAKSPNVSEAVIQKVDEIFEDALPEQMEIVSRMTKSWYQMSQMKPTYEERKAEATHLYTATADFDKMTPADIGRYVPIDINKIPTGLMPAVEGELKNTGGYLMLRKPFYDLIEAVPKVMDCITPPRVRDPNTGLLTPGENIITVQGHRGTGKSTLLAFASQVALAYENTLILAVSFDNIQDMEGMTRASTRRAGVLNQHLYTRRFFEEFAIANKELLQGATLQGDYSAVPWDAAPHPMFEPPKAGGASPDTLPFPDREQVPFPEKKPETVYDLCCLGAWRADLAPELFYSFCYELQKAKNMNVVVLLDAINYVDHLSDYRHPETLKPVMYRDMSFAHALLGFLTTPPTRGFVMTAVSSKATMKNAKHYMSAGSLNLELVNYTKLEMQNMFDHYTISRFLRYEPEVDTFRRAEVLTNGNPADCYKICTAL